MGGGWLSKRVVGVDGVGARSWTRSFWLSAVLGEGGGPSACLDLYLPPLYSVCTEYLFIIEFNFFLPV